MRKFLILILITIVVLPSTYAVLKEKDLTRTLGVLKLELENDAKKQKEFMARYQFMHQEQHNKLVDYMKRCEQIGLMLYSQKADFTFDVAFACQQATDLYKELNETNLPYDRIKTRIILDIERYDSLISMLEALPPSINNQEELFALDSATIDSFAKIDSIIFDSLNADSNIFQRTLPQIDTLKFNTLQSQDSAIAITLAVPFSLDKKEQDDRLKCVEYAMSLRDNLLIFLELLKKDSQYYEGVSKQVVKLNDYAKARYEDLKQSIFKNAGTNYFNVLINLPRYINQVKRDVVEKYSSLDNQHSEWRGPVVFMVSVFVVIYILIAVLISNLIMRVIPWFMKKCFPKAAEKFEQKITRKVIDGDELKLKRFPITITLGIAIFGIVISIIRGFLWGNLLIMAVDLMITVAWLLEVVALSLVIRLKGKQVRDGMAIYLPFLTMTFIVILFRIVLIPNSLINILYPIILLVMTLWQLKACSKYKHNLPITDSIYASISLGTLVVATIAAWMGYTLFAVQIIMWWMFQLAAIQTITCVYDLLMMYEANYIVKKRMKANNLQTIDDVIKLDGNIGEKEFEKKLSKAKNDTEKVVKDMKNGLFFTYTWLYDFIYKALIPVVAVVSVLWSIYKAADIFEMTGAMKDVFFYQFIDSQGVLQLSLYKLCLVVAVFFVFRYLNYALRSYYYHWYKKTKKSTDDMNDTLVRNVIAILVWGGYFIFALILLKVPKGGISLVTAGLATGMGFAMKDLLENFFYGISLMTGRVRVGDFIECDGIQGKVESITYQSTQIITIDGSVMAFLNSQLFNKNFKNLTRNNSYVLVKIPVGVAYGSNVNNVRNIIIDAIRPLCGKTKDGRNIVSPKYEIGVAFGDFGASSVDLIVTIWMLVEQKIAFTAQVKEAIYNALNKNNIEIPFPQTDLYIKELPKNLN